MVTNAPAPSSPLLASLFSNTVAPGAGGVLSGWELGSPTEFQLAIVGSRIDVPPGLYQIMLTAIGVASTTYPKAQPQANLIGFGWQGGGFDAAGNLGQPAETSGASTVSLTLLADNTLTYGPYGQIYPYCQLLDPLEGDVTASITSFLGFLLYIVQLRPGLSPNPSVS